MISIIVPVYNVQEYLERCVKSILQQKNAEFEIILINDGSTDNSHEICCKLEKIDSRIITINQQNKGLSGARNTGIDNASGDYIFFLDSDDWLIGDQVFFMMLNKIINESSDIVIGQTVNSTKQNNQNNVMSSDISSFFHTSTCFSACNKLYRRTVIGERRFKIGIINEDVEFNSYFLFNSKLSFVNINTYHYFQRSGSIQHTFSIKRFDMIDSVIIALVNLSESNLCESQKKTIYANLFAFQLFSLNIAISISSGVNKFVLYKYFHDYLLKRNLFTNYYNNVVMSLRLIEKNKIKYLKKIILLRICQLLSLIHY